MKLASMGEMPPRTFVIRGFSARTASHAAFTISLKMRHSGSTSKSQWDMLFGSFHSITASTICLLPNVRRIFSTDVDFVFGIVEDRKSRVAQHGLYACFIWNPPVGWIVRVTVLDEAHLGKSRVVKHRGLLER